MRRPLPDLQPLSAKRAEAERPYHGSRLLKDEKVAAMFRERADTAIRDLEVLANRGVRFTPFLEIGAGSVQRSAALIHRWHAQGAATDISMHSLRDMPEMLMLLGYQHGPMRICCDAHSIPFEDNTFQFVFCYQTLHHFPNPVPVVAECHRVLGSGGWFFFNEEPMDSPLKRFLRGGRHLSHPMTPPQKIAHGLHVDRLFWDDSALELSLGMVEARFDIGLWRQTLRVFDKVEVETSKKFRLRSDLYRPYIAATLSGIWGGNVMGLCHKSTGIPTSEDFSRRLRCVDCYSSSLSREEGIVRCVHCGRRYPLEDGILRMLPKDLDSSIFGVSS